MKILSLTYYPIKSASGISVESLDYDEAGPLLDRQWMLVDENNRFFSQRNLAKMALIKTGLRQDHIEVRMANHRLELPLEPAKEPKSEQVSVFKDQVPAYEVSDQISKAFSSFLEQKVRLMRFSGPREKTRKNHTGRMRFADGYPFLLASQASFSVLQSDISGSVDISRFRANIVIDGTEPFSEDEWEHISFADQKFFCVKPCTRCQVTNVDQKTGTSTPEVLKWLAKNRKTPEGVTFGINLFQVPEMSTGTLRVGDPVRIEAQKTT